MQKVKVKLSLEEIPFSSAHSLDHFFAELHRGRERLGITAENEAKVNVEKTSIVSKEKVVKVS